LKIDAADGEAVKAEAEEDWRREYGRQKAIARMGERDGFRDDLIFDSH